MTVRGDLFEGFHCTRGYCIYIQAWSFISVVYCSKSEPNNLDQLEKLGPYKASIMSFILLSWAIIL